MGTMSWNTTIRTPVSFQNPVGYYQRCSEIYINCVVNLNTSGRAQPTGQECWGHGYRILGKRRNNAFFSRPVNTFRYADAQFNKVNEKGQKS